MVLGMMLWVCLGRREREREEEEEEENIHLYTCTCMCDFGVLHIKYFLNITEIKKMPCNTSVTPKNMEFNVHINGDGGGEHALYIAREPAMPPSTPN